MAGERTMPTIGKPCNNPNCGYWCNGITCDRCGKPQYTIPTTVTATPLAEALGILIVPTPELESGRIILFPQKEGQTLAASIATASPKQMAIVDFRTTEEKLVAELTKWKEENARLKAQLNAVSERVVRHYPQGWAFDSGNLPLMVDNIVRFMELKITGAHELMEKAKVELAKATNNLFEAL